MSRGNDAIRYAFSVGYRLAGNSVQHPRAPTPRRLTINAGGYFYFSVKVPDYASPSKVLLHRYVAYTKFGERVFRAGVVVRHLDGNPKNNDPSNIAIGTQRQNCLDRPEVERQAHAMIAGRARRALTKRQADSLRRDRRNGDTYDQLQTKYGVSRGTVSHTVNAKFY